MKPRTTTDCGSMTPEEKHAHRLAQKKASHRRCMADPARRAAVNAYARKQHEAKHGPRTRADLSVLTPEQKKARKREQQRTARQRRKDDPAYRAKQRVVAKARVVQKREWRRAHAAELNARRQQDRARNPQKYRAQESAAKKRRRAAKKANREQESKPR